MAVLSKNFKNIIDTCAVWWCQNREQVRKWEAFLYCLCYLTCKPNFPIILQELILFTPNLIRSLNKNLELFVKSDTNPKIDLKYILLNVLQECATHPEIIINYYLGEKPKWIFLICLQLFVFVSKLKALILFNQKYNWFGNIKVQSSNTELPKPTEQGFVLRRSGKVIRKVIYAPQLPNRLWKPPTLDANKHVSLGEDNNANLKLLAGELLYILKPLVNLNTLLKYDFGSWKPWFISLALGIISHYLLCSSLKGQPFSSTNMDQIIMYRRFSFIQYLFMPPFYGRYMKNKLEQILSKLHLTSLLRALDSVQKEYSGLWS